MIAKNDQQVAKQAKSAVIKSRQQPIWHVVSLNILTICGYSIIWFYKNWKQLHEFAKKDYLQIPDAESSVKGSPQLWKYLRNMKPWLHTFGVILPYFQVYFFFLCFKQIAEVSPKWKGSPYSIGILLAVCYAGVLSYGARFDLFALLALLSTFPLAYSQNQLNAFWQTVEPSEARIRKMFSVEEWFFAVLGVGFLFCYLIFLIIGPFLMKFMEQKMH